MYLNDWHISAAKDVIALYEALLANPHPGQGRAEAAAYEWTLKFWQDRLRELESA